MSDNSTLPATGDSIRTVDKAGTKTQVVTLDLGGSGAESLVAGSLPVTGTFWQATQPVSGTVAVSNFPATQAVSGTFWQATQPVSIAAAVAVTDNEGSLTIDSAQLPAALAAGGGMKVEGVAGGVALPVSGTFWQATQPVSGTVAVSNSSFPVTDNAGSLTVDAPVGTPVFVRLSDGAAAISTLPVSAASLPLPTGASTESTLSTLNGKVTACNTGAVTISAVPTLTKGTQGATGFSIQPLRDAGRTLCAFTASAVTTVTSEALVTLTPYRDLTAGGNATTFAVTSNKKLRLQTLCVTVRCTSTVNVGGIVRFRMLAGTVLVGSPVHFSVGGQGSNLATAVAGNAMSYFVDFPEGFELSGTMQFGLTQLFSATTATIDVHVIGYEY